MSEPKQRYHFIDLLRFVAVFFMIQGHVFDALLSTLVKAQPLYYLHDFFHGFIAPVFLFSSGAAYGVSTIKTWDEQIVWGTRMQRRIGKFLGLLAIGYALHLPYFSLRKTIYGATPAEQTSLLQVDALHCIAVTLILLQAAAFLIRKKEAFARVVAVAAVAVIFTAPLMWSTQFTGKIPLWLGAYLNAENGSWFPLFPWSAYILCGVVFGYIFVNAGEQRQAVSTVRKIFALSGAVLLSAFLISYLPIAFYPAHDFWKANPVLFFVRSSAVSILACCIFFTERFISSSLRVPRIMGRETLFIYVLHLLIVYGSVLGPGMSRFIGPTLSLPQAIGVFALVLAAIAGITVVWNDLKSKHATAALRIRFSAAALFLLAFIIRPW